MGGGSADGADRAVTCAGDGVHPKAENPSHTAHEPHTHSNFSRARSLGDAKR